MRQRANWLCGLVASVLGIFIIAANADAFPVHIDARAARSSLMNLAADADHGPASRIQGLIANLHAKLHITAGQEPRFKAMAEVMSANAEALETLLHQRAQDKDTSAVASMHWYERLVEAHADALKKFVPALEQLYASLSDEQKRTADATFARFGERPRPSHHHYRHHHHHHRSE